MTNNARKMLLKLSTGVLPESLNKFEVTILEKEFGNNWFWDLGYSEKKYKKPGFK